MKKFIMELIWHNCQTNPPQEDKNNNLYISNGNFVHKVLYNKDFGWCDWNMGVIIPNERLSEYWWADIEQTARGCRQFDTGGSAEMFHQEKN